MRVEKKSPEEKKKVSISKSTADKLKTFSRLNGLKMRLVIDSMVEIMLTDDVLSQQVAEITLAKNEDGPEQNAD